MSAGSPTGTADGANVPADEARTGRRLRLGTRGSALALAQSGMIAEALRALGATVEVLTIRTAGDGRAPDTVWGEGAFVSALEAALLDGTIDVAVHSAKDVPTARDPRLRIAAFPAREDPRDALVTADPGLTLASLPPGARIGTDSPRRCAFLLAHRPDLRPHPLHGNVDTRLRRLAEGESDALVLAVAGLTRLGLADRITQIIPPDVVPPAPGQGALAVQCRADDAATGHVVERLDDPATRAAVEAERAFLAATGGGCRAPIGALAIAGNGTLALLVGAADPADVPAGDAPAGAAAEASRTTFTGVRQAGGPVRVAWLRRSAPAGEGIALAEALAGELPATIDRRAGAGTSRQTTAVRPRVLVTRQRGRVDQLVAELRARELDPVHVPTIAVEPVRAGGPLDSIVPSLGSYDWVVVTSPTGADALGAAARRRGGDLSAARIASVGAATSAAVERAGGRVAFVPAVATAASLAAELPISDGSRVLLVRGNLADCGVGDRLRDRGAIVDEVVAYRTIEGPAASEVAAREALRAGLEGLVFTSGSTVRGLLALLPTTARDAARAVPAFCIGPSTAAVAKSAGFTVVHESTAPDPGAVADLVRAGVAAPADPRPVVTAALEKP
jgi:hydroxymethylbilane synthase